MENKQDTAQNVEVDTSKMMNPLYQRVSESEAQACAWVYTTPEKVERYFYRHPVLGAKDVRSRVLFAGVCRTDIEKGTGKMKVPYPFCGGHEAVCEVIEVGSDVSSVKLGDKILCGPVRDSCMQCDMCKMGETQMCTKMSSEEKQNINGKYFGSFSTHLQQPESHCFKMPDGMDIETLAPMMCAGITVYRPLAMHTKKGDHIAVLGLGGLGHLAVQFAHKMGLMCDAFISKKDMEDFHAIRGLGVTNMIEWDNPDMLSKMQNQYDLILNVLPISLPAVTMDAILRTIKGMGKFIQIGLPSSDEKFVASYEMIIRRDIELIGSMCAGKKDTDAMLKFAKSNDVKCQCDFYEFDDFPKAIEHVAHGKPTFRTVVRVDHASRRFKQ